MTILNELKAAYAALPKIDKKDWFMRRAGYVTQVIDNNDGPVCEIEWDNLPEGPVNNRAHLIALMKNNLPALIECAEALGHLVEHGGGYVFSVDEDKARAALAKLKGE